MLVQQQRPAEVAMWFNGFETALLALGGVVAIIFLAAIASDKTG